LGGVPDPEFLGVAGGGAAGAEVSTVPVTSVGSSTPAPSDDDQPSL